MIMSSKILSIILTTIILFSSMRVTFTYAYYQLDPIGFIENLCENKDKPELQCNGKCHLKKVAESNSENQQNPPKFTSLKEITFFVVDIFEITFISIKYSSNKNFEYKNLYAFSGIHKIDRPPQI